jgi:hypothetical protein
VNEDDWLNEPAPDYPVAKPDEGQPADASTPGLPVTEQALAAAITAQERRGQFIAAWGQLSDNQRVFLNTWRESRFNYARTFRVLAGTPVPATKTGLHRWRETPGFEFVEKMLRSASVEEILSRDYLVARHEDIVETALTPAAVLHQGVATGHFEVEAGVAARANETLLKVGGHLKEDKQELNVGIIGPSFIIQVMQPDGVLRDITPRGVTIDLPAPAEDDWLKE